MIVLRRWNSAFRSESEAVILSAACLFSGAISLAGYTPASVEITFTELVRFCWSVSLVVGGMLRIMGLLSRRVRLDALGCLLLGWAALVFGLAITKVSPRGIVGALLIAAFGYGCLSRWWQYYRLGKAQRTSTDGAS